jgi:hypothetical protein
MRRLPPLILCVLCASAVNLSADTKLNFSRDIHPILTENCFTCHGPDEKARKAKLRLDIPEGAFKKHDDKAAIVPSHTEQSELVRRILTTDPDDHMPPPDSGKKLTPRQIDLLQQWIKEGADYTKHWSFQPISTPPIPPIGNPFDKLRTTPQSAIRNPIDNFILARLEKEGLTQSPQASKQTLIRRVTFDLTGLPPTLGEIDAFLADASPDAYEKVVDRLLANPHYGERMALDWLDAARFSDTHGYHIDAGRDMTRWREWVIDAFNANLPFDRFTIWQIAGDLLPNATLEQKIASGFNRNHMINFEGGAIPEEYHTAYLIDRVNTTSTVWMGLTVGCAQCHDHKYDPIKQKEFYQLYAFFNNLPENGLDGRKGNAVPLIKTPTHAEEQRLLVLMTQLNAAQRNLAIPNHEADAAQAEWEKTADLHKQTLWTPLDPTEFTSKGGAKLEKQPNKSIRAIGPNPPKETYTIHATSPAKPTTALRFEVFPDDSLQGKGPGRSDNGNIVLTEFKILADEKPLKLKRASADFAQKDFPPANAIDNNPNTGWAIHPEVGKPHQLVIELDQPLPPSSSITAVIEFNSRFASHQPGRFRLSATDSANPHSNAALDDAIVKILSTPADQRTPAQAEQLRRYYRTNVSPIFKSARDQLAALEKSKKDLEENVRTTMVMEEMPKPRETHVLTRGMYDKPGEKVAAETPTCLPPLPKDAPHNRLGLAQWLVSKDHPLTARVTVNRFWQAYFGAGIVKTVEDLGSQGEWPSHPQLLDYLASRFIQSNWDVKAMQRLIVTSATYRQASNAAPELIAKDPENRLLARGPRVRLPAEFIRDQALAISGLLNDEIGGASVLPYQPAGLWEELMSREDGANWTAQTYTQSHGKDLYRRTMYTFWKRTSPPPTLSTFDAPDREVCTVRRSRTNTPLQALVLLNDPTYIEASRKLAERVLTESGPATKDRINFAFRLATARLPTAAELIILQSAYEKQSVKYRAHPDLAEKLLKVGESPAIPKLDKSDVAAWSIVCSIILNLDETITKS